MDRLVDAVPIGMPLHGPKQLPTLRPPILARRHAVASGHYLASVAGLRILDRGGNAVDAGVAAGLVLNVVQSDYCNLGGVAPIVVYQATTDEVVTVAGVGPWPKAVSLEFFRDRGYEHVPLGVLSTVVPAAVDAWLTTLARYGTMSLAEVAEQAIELAEDGFLVHQFLHDNLTRYGPSMRRSESTRHVYFPNGDIPKVGERFVQRDLAGTLRSLVDAERAASHLGRSAAITSARHRFYRGDIAERIVRFVLESGGVLSLDDLSEFSVEVGPAVSVSYRGYEVFSCGPWSQGPVVLQGLNILSGYEMAQFAQNSTDSLHHIAEALKLALADRNRFYGDPRCVDVPIEMLLSAGYAAERRKLLDPDRAAPIVPPAGDGVREAAGAILAANADASLGPNTSYVCVVDRDGNAFSATPSDGAVTTNVVPGLGIVASDRGRQSWLDPANPASVGSGRRPRLTPNPGLVKRGRSFVMPYGTPGADMQTQAMLQFLINVIDHKMDPQQAIEAPRIGTFSHADSQSPHPASPALVRAEARIADLDKLAERGHRIERWPAWTPQAGALCAIAADREAGTLTGAADNRRVSYALGW